MSSELLLILVVALIVFGPKKLPMLATHLGLIVRQLNQLKTKASLLWEHQLNELHLEDNKRKAAEADKHYETNPQSD
jgi:sec-independent protein translocase protein TatB